MLLICGSIKVVPSSRAGTGIRVGLGRGWKVSAEVGAEEAKG